MTHRIIVTTALLGLTAFAGSVAAQETGRAAEDVLTAARTVAERAHSLRDQVDAFLTNVRAA